MIYLPDDLSTCPWTYSVKFIGTAGSGHYTYQDWVEVKKGISHSHTYTAYQDTITNEVKKFTEIVSGKGGEVLSSVEDAVWAQKTLEAAAESVRSGRTISISDM